LLSPLLTVELFSVSRITSVGGRGIHKSG
jgi:hypothetical protein